MPIIAQMRPDIIPMSWDGFCAQMPARSIALDGFVDAPPALDAVRLYRNFDHHRGPPRSDMLCTAMQVLEAVRTGLLDLFMPTGDEDVLVWMNDCDPDVGLSLYALEYHWIVRGRVNPAIHRLFGHVQDMDKMSGLLDVPRDMPIVRQAAFIFQPYWQYRTSGALDQKNALAHMGVLRDVTHRINEFVAGRPRELAIDDRYDELGGGADWRMVRELGPHARMKMARRGVRAFVAARQKTDGRWVYTVCRQSPYVFWFPVPEICAHLNREEADSDQFGGGDVVFGNARGNGSVRSPEQITTTINAFLQDHNLRAP
ncbi:hypothetical protein HZA85_01270 [Candidatus Uhrbacteria bacterium]|nr:hypothetical protein [Candidatus Uhrbacteria bacterium]